MTSLNLSKAENDLLIVVFQNADSSNLNYAELSAAIGCEQKQMAGKTFNLRKKVKSGNISALTPNESVLIQAIFRKINTGKLNYSKISSELGCKKGQMAGKMFNLRKKLGVNSKSTAASSAESMGAVADATRSANKSAVRKAARNADVDATPTKGQDRPRKSVPDYAEPESDVEVDVKDEEMGNSSIQGSQGSARADSEGLDENHVELYQNSPQALVKKQRKEILDEGVTQLYEGPQDSQNIADYDEYDETSPSQEQQTNGDAHEYGEYNVSTPSRSQKHQEDQEVNDQDDASAQLHYSVQAPVQGQHSEAHYDVLYAKYASVEDEEEQYYDANEEA